MEEVKNTPKEWTSQLPLRPHPQDEIFPWVSCTNSLLPLMPSGVGWLQLQSRSSLLRVWGIWHIHGAQGLNARSKPHKVFSQPSAKSHVHPDEVGKRAWALEAELQVWVQVLKSNWRKWVGRDRSLFPSCSWYPTERVGRLTRPALAQVHVGGESLHIEANPCDTSFCIQFLSHWAFSSSSHWGHSWT